MIDRLDPRASAADLDRLQREITTFGLEYNLTTPFTSFVAIDDRNLDPHQSPDPTATPPAVEVAVATPPPAGVAASAHGGPTPSGSAAPEPTAWLAGALVFAMAWLPKRLKIPAA